MVFSAWDMIIDWKQKEKLKKQADKCLQKRIEQGFSGNALLEKLKSEGKLK